MMVTSSRPAGDGFNKLKQVLEKMSDERAKRISTHLMFGTVIAPDTIRLDEDGYDLLSAEGDYLVAAGVHFKTGDRIVAAPISGPRGRIFVLGRWSPTRTVGPYQVSTILEFFDDTGGTTPTDAGGTATVTARKQFSRGWCVPGSQIRLVGEVTRNGGVGDCTVNVIDDVGGTIATQALSPDGQFSITISRDDIDDNDLNFVAVELTYDDAVENTATISSCVMLVGEP